MYIYIYMYVYICIFISICMCVYIYICALLHRREITKPVGNTNYQAMASWGILHGMRNLGQVYTSSGSTNLVYMIMHVHMLIYLSTYIYICIYIYIFVSLKIDAHV